MRYFTKTFKPDIIDGDISKIIEDDKTDTPFAAGDILFDWVAVDLPKGTCAIVDAFVHMFGEDGGDQSEGDFHLLIAKSNDGVAPTTLGEENAVVTGCYELPEILMGAMKFEGTSNRVGKLNYAFGSVWMYNTAGNGGALGPLFIEPDVNVSNTTRGSATQRIYVAGIAGGAFDFSTGVLAAGNVSDDTAADTTVKTVDVRNCFRPGDVVYIHDVDTPIGTESSLPDATSLILTANNDGAISINDELLNASPITVTLGFQGR